MGNTQGEHLTPYEPSRECISPAGVPWGPLGLGANPPVGCPRQLEAALVSWRWAAVFIGRVPDGSHGHPEGTRNRQVGRPWEPQAPWPPLT